LVSQVKIDEIDVKILKALLKDARTSFADIARDCGISTTAIVKRFYNLKRSGVIAGTSIRVDLKKIGYNYRLSVDINIEGGNEFNIGDMCKKLPNSVACYQVVGKYDIHTIVYIKTLEQIEQIRQIVKKQEGVKRVGLTATYEGGIFPENLLIQPTEISGNG
jgi:Lrp/AsnC family transcriptional regulator for asnA, asnC and gidA